MCNGTITEGQRFQMPPVLANNVHSARDAATAKALGSISEWVGDTYLVTGVSVLCARLFLERMQATIMAEMRQVHVPQLGASYQAVGFSEQMGIPSALAMSGGEGQQGGLTGPVMPVMSTSSSSSRCRTWSPSERAAGGSLQITTSSSSSSSFSSFTSSFDADETLKYSVSL